MPHNRPGSRAPRLLCACLTSALVWTCGGLRAWSDAEQGAAQRLCNEVGLHGGVVVHLGCGDGRLTVHLQATPTTIVQGLEADPRQVEAARRRIIASGKYGKVSVERFAGPRLPYSDNLVNLLVVERPGDVPREELLRVLTPGGTACVRNGAEWNKTVKPRGADIDEWTHYLHDPSNNAVAHDAQVGPPRRLQWISAPDWSRHHDHMASLSALVSAGGRVFYIIDEGPREAILLPAQWALVARDAFNGALLWKRPIAEWNTQLWPLKSGPNQLPRRLVAVGDRVYATLGIDAPLEILDAATGKTLQTCAGTQHADEALVSDGMLFALVGKGPNKWKDYRPKHTYVWANSQRANKDWAWDGEERSIAVFDAQSGAPLWKRASRVAPLTLAVDARRVVFYNGEAVVALDRNTGRQLWASESITRKLPFPTGYGPTLVLHDDVALLSIESPSMTAFSASDGKKLWTAKHHRGGHASPDDMLIIDGLVWSADVANGNNSGAVTGRDLHTGEVKREFPPDVHPDWFHHRCYRSRATDQYFLASRTGIEFIDLKAERWNIHHWVRGGCLYGFIPANGLLYAPPHACGCFLESKLFGFTALAAEAKAESGSSAARTQPKAESEERLETASGSASLAASAFSLQPSLDWPTYRRDAARSGAAPAAVPTALGKNWERRLGGRLSAVTAAGDKVFFAAIDAHTVHAWNAADGQPAWSFVAGGRVDSPPTIAGSRVYFGSADGCVYCLRAADGALVWRFRAAPAERRLVAYEQLESAWPVSGSVLALPDAICFVAGRSAFLDGGMRLVRLDPASGRLLSETLIGDRDAESGKDLQSLMKGQDMPVALPDILSCDGHSIYMRSQAFDLAGKLRNAAPIKLGHGRRTGEAEADGSDAEVKNHLFSRSGFLDSSWFWRSYWVFGKAVDSNYGGWLRPGHFAPCGRLMVFDDQCVYSFDRKPEYLCNASVQEYYVYRANREVDPEAVDRVQAAVRRIDAASRERSASSSDWATRKKFSLAAQQAAHFHWAAAAPGMQARAMALAGPNLFVAGPPDVLDEEEALRNPDDPAIKAKLAAQVDALRGRRGGQLLVLAAADGQPLAAYELGATPTFDGMAAAYGRLYLTTLDGRVLCLGAGGQPLPAAAAPTLAPIDVKAPAEGAEPTPHTGPSLAGEFAHLTPQTTVTQTPLGYRLSSEGAAIGLALKKLPAPLSGKIRLQSKIRLSKDGQLKNGFLVFGNASDDKQLVKCGLRMVMRKAMIIEGSSSKGKITAETIDIDDETVYNVDALVDLDSGETTLQIGAATVKARLTNPPQAVSFVGFGAINAIADFAAVKVARP